MYVCIFFYLTFVFREFLQFLIRQYFLLNCTCEDELIIPKNYLNKQKIWQSSVLVGILPSFAFGSRVAYTSVPVILLCNPFKRLIKKNRRLKKSWQPGTLLISPASMHWRNQDFR